MTKEKIINDLTTGSVPKKLIRFAIPFMLSNLLQTLYGLVDMIVIGQFVGSAGLSAVSIGAEFMMLFTFIGMGFGSAGQTMIAQYIGLDDRKALQETIGTMFSFILGASIVVSVIGFAISHLYLNLMNTPAEAWEQAMDYLIVCCFGMFFAYGYNIVSSILRGMGDSKHPLVFVAVAAFLNLVLDLLFVAVLDMAAMGAALATVIGQGVSFIVSIIYLYRNRDSFGFDFKLKSFAIKKDKMKGIVKLGLPMALQFSAIVISMLFVNSYINSYGVTASAVNGIGSKLGSVASVVTGAMGLAGSSMVAQNFGAGKQERIPKVVRTSLVINVSFAVLLSIIMILFPVQIFRLWSSDPEVLGMAKVYVPIAVLTFFGFALRIPFVCVVNGVGFAMLSLIIGLMDGVVARVGLALLLGVALDYGIQGFWYGACLAGFVPVFIAGIYYLSGKWKTRSLAVK